MKRESLHGTNLVSVSTRHPVGHSPLSQAATVNRCQFSVGFTPDSHQLRDSDQRVHAARLTSGSQGQSALVYPCKGSNERSDTICYAQRSVTLRVSARNIQLHA